MTADSLETARIRGMNAQYLQDCPYDTDDEGEHHAEFMEGWDLKFRYFAVSYYASQYYGKHKTAPTVAEVAEAFSLTTEKVTEVCGGPYLYLSGHDDTPLAEKFVEVDGE